MTRVHAAPAIWRAPYTWVTTGAISLVFLAALQSLAVTTVMPVVSADLDGAALYAAAFSATLAASVVGMVGAGAWSDRGGPLRPLTLSVALFVAGLIVAGAAPTMLVLVLGRLVQGLGVGGITVALYVVVARAYPADLHRRVFAAFSAAWVVPSLVGPFLSGAVAQYLHWRWVFLGVAVLAVAAFALLAPRLPDMHRPPPATEALTRVLRRLLLAVVTTGGLLAIGLVGEAGVLTAPVVVAGVVLVAVASRPLLPRGTLRSARALPSVVLLRGVLAAAFFSAEVYVPLLFIEHHGFSPVWAGLALTLAAITWAIGSGAQGGVGRAWPDRQTAVGGATIVLVALVAVTAMAITGAPALWVIVFWAVGAVGMGLVYPRLSTLTLAYSSTLEQGANSAALSIADAIGASAAIAALGLVFTAVPPAASFVAVFACAAAICAVALGPAARVSARVEREGR
ncbi:MFS transporter [Microbacterium sp. NPDC091313]